MLKDLLPTLGIILTALFGVITYAFQERAKRQTALSERRQALYEKLIRNLVDLLIATSGDDRSKFITEIEKGWLFASDQVLRASYDYLRIYDDLCHHDGRRDDSTFVDVLTKVRSDEKVRQELGRSLGKIFLAMRRDIRHETVLTADWARQHFQIYDWGAIAKSDKPAPDKTASGK
jgi:hypothetical protein